MLQLLQMIGSGSQQKLYADDVFSTYLYKGNGSTQTINNGIGGDRTVWTKSRSNATAGLIYCTAQGVGKYLVPSSTNGLNSSYPNTLTAFNLNSFSLGADDNSNASGRSSVAWTFADAPKFHAHDVVTKSAGSNAIINFPELETLGMVRVKRTDAAGSWYVWHRSLSAGQLLIGESTAAAAMLGHITVSGTTVTLVNGVIADGTYLVEAFAHDASADGLIQCGSYTGNGTLSKNSLSVDLGHEPQWLLIKNVSAINDGSWSIFDAMRGPASATKLDYIRGNSSDTEETTFDLATFHAQGFAVGNTSNNFLNMSGNTYIYLAIRRPNKPPTSGTQVYNASVDTNSLMSPGFSPDLVIYSQKNAPSSKAFGDRLRGNFAYISPQTAEAEVSYPTPWVFNGPTGTFSQSYSNDSFAITHFFRRAPGFFDVVCFRGNASLVIDVPHNLQVKPELMIVKSRSFTSDWLVYSADRTKSQAGFLNTTSAFSLNSAWQSEPTSNTFKFFGVNNDYVAYLFASLPGISKVGSYTGNGSSQTIDCGFGTGARFFLVKATSATGSWWIFDSVRGIVSAADPALQLNSTSAEITSANAVDPTPVGIIVNQEATCSINMNGVSYVYLAIA